MSSRALRRLQQQQLELDNPDDNAENEDSQPVVVKKRKNKKASSKTGNLFDLLSTEEVPNEDEIEEQDHVEENGHGNNETVEEVKKKKKKSKKKKKKGKESSAKENKEENDGLDEIDHSIREVNEILGLSSATAGGVSAAAEIPVFRCKSLLAVDSRYLNPANEMKRKFGAAIIQTERRRNPHERKFKRPTIMVVPKANWPPYAKVGLAMSRIESETSSSLFTFEHQEMYRNVQFHFYDAVESLDHNNIMALLNAHPYHIDSMLQISEICKMNEDFQMAAELIERALFVFENSFHTMFKLTEGTCRLEYKRAENRPFFLALFRHIHYIGNKACYRTALEFCKVLFALSPNEDPLGVFLLLDFFALKADEFDYFIQLSDQYELTRNVSMLPNFAYSYALAKYHLGKLEEADKALRKALISFPSLVVELMDRCGISLDNKIKTHAFFDPVSYLKQSQPLQQLIALYVGRCDSLWKAPDVLNWFTSNCNYILDHMEEYKKEILDGSESRATRYKLSPKNILRHIIISDIKEALRVLPVCDVVTDDAVKRIVILILKKDVRNQTVMQHDPLPPSDSVSGYERPTSTNSQGGNSNILSLFLESLMPSYNQNQPQNNNDEQELRGEARALDNVQDGQAVNALHGGAQQLMNAMRDLLNTMTYRDDGENVGQGEDNEEEEEEEGQWD